MAETVLPDIAAGALVPDDLGERVVALRRRNEACQARQQALHQLLDGLHHAFRDTQARGADNALAVLRDELDELLTAARPVLDALAGIDDADAAIQADAAGQWRAAGELGARYHELRHCQVIIVAAAIEPPDRPRRTTRISPAVRQLVETYGHVQRPWRHHQLTPAVPKGADHRFTHTRSASGRLTITEHVSRPVETRPWATGDPLRACWRTSQAAC